MYFFFLFIRQYITPSAISEMLSSDTHPPSFIFAYAPWCPHCKVLFQIWEELSEKYKDDPSISIARLNCTDGENVKVCSRIHVRGFPSFFTCTDKVLKSIDVSRNMRDFENVVKKLKKESDREIVKSKLQSAKFPYFIFTIGNGNYAAQDITQMALNALNVDPERVYVRMRNVGINCSLLVYRDPTQFEKMPEIFNLKSIKEFISKYYENEQQKGDGEQAYIAPDGVGKNRNSGFTVAILICMLIIVSVFAYFVFKFYPRNVPKDE